MNKNFSIGILVSLLLAVFCGVAIASQGFVVLPNTTPPGISGTQLVNDVNAIGSSFITMNAGTSAPSYIGTGGMWVNTSIGTSNVLDIFDGANSVAIGNLNTSTHAWFPLGNGSGLTGIGTASLSGITGSPSSTTFLAGNGTWSAITGTLSGGVANYLPLWLTPTSIGTSNIYQSGSSIGIGSTSPRSLLDVAGTIYATAFNGSGASLTSIGTSNMTAVTGSPSSTTFLRGDNSWATVSSGSGTVSTGTAGYAAYYQSNGTTVVGTSTLQISGGNVGIGTAPGALLDVYSSNSGMSKIRITNAGSEVASLQNDFNWGRLVLVGSGDGVSLGGQNSSQANYITPGSTGLTIGNNSAAVSKLDIYGNVSIGTGYATASAAPTNGLIVQGNVAIGTTTANGALNVSGTTTSTLFSGSGASLTSIGTSSLAAVTGTGTSVVLAASPTLTGTVAGAAATWTGNDTALAFIPTGTATPTIGMSLNTSTILQFNASSTNIATANTLGWHFKGTGVSLGGTKTGMGFEDIATGGASGLRAGIDFDINDGTTANVPAIGISPFKENSTTGNNAASMVFATSNNGGGTLTEWMRLTSTGALTIGTASPIASGILTIRQGSVSDFVLGSSINASGVPGISMINDAGAAFEPFAIGGSPIVMLGGNVGIGTSSSSFQLRVQGTLDATGAVTFPGLASSSAATTGTVCWTTSIGNLTVDTTVSCLASLEELKDIKGNIANALPIIEKIKPFWFTWKKDTPEYVGDTHEQAGMGAHQVESVDKRLVAYNPDGKLKGVRYQEITAVLVEAIKEQQQEIDDLRSQIGLHPHHCNVFCRTHEFWESL